MYLSCHTRKRFNLNILRPFIIIFTSLLSISAFAGGGFTWANTLIHSLHLPLEEYVLTFIITSLILLVVTFLYRSSLSSANNFVVPDKGITLRNIVESYGQFIMNQCRTVIGEEMSMYQVERSMGRHADG